MNKGTRRRRKVQTTRFGIGEWFGRSFVALQYEERRQLASLVTRRGQAKPQLPCPFQSKEKVIICNKRGGVCSLRLYTRSGARGTATAVQGTGERLRTVCPKRFEEEGLMYRWVGQTLLGDAAPMAVGEIPFLENPRESKKDVGRIDKVLIVPGTTLLKWCALEAQAVYFSGDKMGKEWPAIAQYRGPGLPFPAGNRRPDYRSSGPKRLMPQLQIKVPSLRRWGKKMAVVVDRDFWDAFGPMDEVQQVANCDVAWFVVTYQETSEGFRLATDSVHLTTLERSVEGLTAGLPVSLEAFEQRILAKLRVQ